MQALLSLCLSIYIFTYAFESVVRYGLHLIGHDELIFVRDALLIVPMGLLFCQQFMRRCIHPAYYIFLFVVGLHGFVMYMNIGSTTAIAYGAKILTTVLAGALLADRIFQPKRWAVIFYFILWIVTFAGVMIDKYEPIEFPWANMETTIGDVQVDISRNWETGGADKRAGGFTRSSIHAAIITPFLALILFFHLRNRVLRWIVTLMTLPVIFWTTQKGSLLAYVLTLGMLGVAPKKPIRVLRLGFIAATLLAVLLPIGIPGTIMPHAEGQFSMMSFNLRVEQMWPEAWAWISQEEAFPFGVGLGGIGGAQRFYAPVQINAADNFFVFLYASFGAMAFFYVGYMMYVVVRQRADAPASAQHAAANAVLIMLYGIVLSLVEDQMAALFMGATFAQLAVEIKRRTERVPDASLSLTPA